VGWDGREGVAEEKTLVGLRQGVSAEELTGPIHGPKACSWPKKFASATRSLVPATAVGRAKEGGRFFSWTRSNIFLITTRRSNLCVS
jgi:hypothetical protein